MTALRITILGLTITSSWGNGHATTYRSLVRGLAGRGHQVTFLERDKPWYRDNRDLPQPPYGQTHLYDSVTELEARWGGDHRRIRSGDRRVLCAGRDCGGRAGAAPGTGCQRVLRHRYPGDAGGAGSRAVRLPHASADPRLSAVSVVHRRADAGRAGNPLRIAGGARAVLLGRCAGLRAGAECCAALGSWVSGHLQRRPAAGASGAAVRSGACVDTGKIRGGRAAISGHDRLARELRAHRTSGAGRAAAVLRRPALHAERDPGRYGATRLEPQRGDCSRPRHPVRRSSATGGRGWMRCSARIRKS